MARDYDGSDYLRGTANAHGALSPALRTTVVTFSYDGSAGTMWELATSFGGSATERIDVDGAILLNYVRLFSTTNGVWRWDTTPVASTVYHFVVSYDDGSSSNHPIFYINGVKYTEGSGMTRRFTTSGTAVSGGDSFTTGALNDGVSDFITGQQQELAWWNVILPDEICLALSLGYSPKFFPTDRVEYFPLLGNNTESVDSANGLDTNSGTTVIDHLPTIYPSRQQIIPAVAAVGGAEEFLSRMYPQGVMRGVMRGAA